MAQVQIKGDIIPNDDKWMYDWLEWDSTCPKDVQSVIDALAEGEELFVTVNSGGGSVMAGQEIYSLLKRCPTTRVEIEGIAGSAAGVAAMGGSHVAAYPVAMIMIHNVAVGGASGDYHAMDKYSAMLKQMNKAMSAAYTEKSGMALDDVLKIMDRETWLTANQALEHGFVDEIITDRAPTFTNDIGGMRLTDEIRQRVIAEKAAREVKDNRKQELLESLNRYL